MNTIRRSGLAGIGLSAFLFASPAPAQPAPDKKPATSPTPAPGKEADKPVTPAKESPAAPKDAAPKKEEKAPEPPADPFVLKHTVKDIDGKDVDLSRYKGKVVMIVNVASQCGFTYQYKGLEELYQSKKDQGLVILAFPANNFGSQEPGTNEEIKSFCATNFKTADGKSLPITFPLFAKISVKGDDQHPLYKQLAAQPAPIGGDPGWNFTKFLVDRSGKVVARFDSRTKPQDQALTTKMDELLKQK